MTWLKQPADLKDYFAFVYIIRCKSTNEWYLGKKHLWTVKKGKIVKESDWKDYWSSSKELQDMVAKNGEADFEREIIKVCVSPGEATWIELEELILRRAMYDPLCLNKNVMMTLRKSSISGYNTKERRNKYLKTISNQKKKAGLIL